MISLEKWILSVLLLAFPVALNAAPESLEASKTVGRSAEQTGKVPLGALPPEACGVWSWYSWGGTPNQWNGKITAAETYPGLRGIPIVVGWDKLEPEDGVYQWELFDRVVFHQVVEGSTGDGFC